VLAVVSGSARGLGLAFCAELARRGDDVIATCRRATPELAALGVEVVENVDVTSADAVAHAATAVEGRPVDLVLANAALYDSGGLDELDYETMLHEYDVNALGAVRLVSALLPTLREGSKIALVSSRGGSMGGNFTALAGGNYGYRMSKAALNLFGVLLSGDLRDRGVAVQVLHPGFVATDMARQGADRGRAPTETPRPAPEVARDLLDRIDELTLEGTGRWIDPAGDAVPW
jgi:NAD(P)-dependent dehydrogenase (short-subunit alcohol dehydrogenase family)